MKKKLRPQGEEEEGLYEDPQVNSFPKGHFRQGLGKGSGQPRLVDEFGKGRGHKSHELRVSMPQKDELMGGSPNAATENGEGEAADGLKLVLKKTEDDLGPDGPRSTGTSHLTIKLKLPSRAYLEKDDGAAKSGATDSSSEQRWPGANLDAAVANSNSDWCSKAHEVSSLPDLTSDHAQTDPCDANSYYLRPKVSQWHLKASRMEAGISEPRFRQPCSRFPVLTGFHKGKRSCRRRLASQVKRKSTYLGSFTYLSGKPRQGSKYGLLLRPSDSLERATILQSKGAHLRDNAPAKHSHKRHHWDNGGTLECFARESKHMLVCKDDQGYTSARFQNGGLYAEPSSTSNITSLHESICSSKGSKKERDFLPLANMPNCQVEGCQNELSNAREYYRRRKVCEWHSKASKVYVDNAEQRFCQQCSRFHVLAEFDEGRRSCRRMLAGHNERRRKPPLSRVLSKRPMNVECTNSKVVQVYVRRKKRFLDRTSNLQVENSNLEAFESLDS